MICRAGYSLWAAALLGGALTAAGVETLSYSVVRSDDRFEVRRYDAYIVAEVVVEGDMEEAGNRAFGTLFEYISGKNRPGDKIAMTAPVEQRSKPAKIPMTAPVEQRAQGDRWAVAFVMPASYTLDTLPDPENPDVMLRKIPARRVAAVRYSGFWSRKNYRKHRDALQKWIKEQNLTPAGPPVWARYNPPFIPWFLRRNEVLIPVKTP